MTTLQTGTQLGIRARATTKGQGRSLQGYLLLPRPKDLGKAVIVPLTFGLGIVATGGTSPATLRQAGLVWLVLELLVYQARYQWNDIRGFAADQAHPDGSSRGRLPGPIEQAGPHIRASAIVAASRLLVAAAVAMLLPGVRGLIIAMTVGVFGVAVIYEHVRSLATGRTDEVPVPLHPSLIGVWVAVGAGYAVRGMVGLALAVRMTNRPALVISAVVSMWAIGVVFVTCRWALEAMCFASFEQRRVVWNAAPSTAREHTLGLVRWLPRSLCSDPWGGAAPEPSRWRALQGRSSLTAPWNVGVLVAGGASAVAGRLLVRGLSLDEGLVVGLLGVLAALLLSRLDRWRGLAAPALALATTIVQAAQGFANPVAADLPLLFVLLAYVCFTRQCAAEVGRPLRRLEPLLRR